MNNALTLAMKAKTLNIKENHVISFTSVDFAISTRSTTSCSEGARFLPSSSPFQYNVGAKIDNITSFTLVPARVEMSTVGCSIECRTLLEDSIALGALSVPLIEFGGRGVGIVSFSLMAAAVPEPFSTEPPDAFISSAEVIADIDSLWEAMSSMIRHSSRGAQLGRSINQENARRVLVIESRPSCEFATYDVIICTRR